MFPNIFSSVTHLVANACTSDLDLLHKDFWSLLETVIFSPVRRFGELFSRCDSSVVMKENIIFLELQGKGVKCCLVSTWVKPKGQNINSAFYFSVCWNFLMRSWENVSVSQLLPMLPT